MKKNKISFFYDFHQISNLKNTFKNHDNENSIGSCINYNNNANNNNIAISESYKIKNDEKPKSNFNGFDQIISKYSARITREESASNNLTIGNKGRNKNNTDFQSTGIAYDFDKEAEGNLFEKVKDIRPFNLSYMKLSKMDRKKNKAKKNFDGEI